MTYRLTILNVSTAAFLAGILFLIAWNYSTLITGEGWGMVSMIGLTGVWLVAGLADLILQQLIKNRKILNVIGLAIATTLLTAILLD